MKTHTSANNADAVSVGVQLVKIDEERDGQRIDNFLSGRLKGVPRSLIYRILRTGQVRINGRRAKPDVRLSAGDEVRIPPVRVAEREDHGRPGAAQMSRVEDAIVHEDRDFLVLNKPSGVASHGGSGISFGAIELLRAARPKDTLELVHRLDRDTSGVLVFSRRRSALTGLQAVIREGRATKHYMALLQGQLAKPRITINEPLRKSILQGGERMVRVDAAGKASVSHLIQLQAFAQATLCEVSIETGRTHQIRVHTAHIGHAVAGDEKYGEKLFNQSMRELGLRRLFLHAMRFEFELGERNYAFSAAMPDDLRSVISALERSKR
jgi:23S rRNA pseudouridine955/2504/2580 synthase